MFFEIMVSPKLRISGEICDNVELLIRKSIVLIRRHFHATSNFNKLGIFSKAILFLRDF